MFDLLSCVQNEHDSRLLGLAIAVCIIAAASTVVLLRQARNAHGAERTRWVLVAGTASGFGTWATHFIAMIGYNSSIVKGYELTPTLLSLLVVAGSISTGFAIALRSQDWRVRWFAGGIIGAGVAAMHYIGMAAVEMSASYHLSTGYVVASVIAAIGPNFPVLSWAIDRNDRRSGVGAAGLIVLGIFSLHFIGMAGITLLPSRMPPSTDIVLSSFGLALSVAAAAAFVLIMGMVAAIVRGRTKAAIDANAREFKALIQGISDCAIYMLSTDGRVASWNAGAQRLKGYTQDEAIGLELAAFYSPEEREAGVPAHDIETARRDGIFNAQGWRYRKDGSRFWAHVTIEAVRNEYGEFQGFAKITRDMTRMKEDQERLEAALSNMHQGLCLFDSEERLVLANGRVADMFRAAPEDFPMGTPFELLVRHVLVERAGGEVNESLVAETLARHRACILQPNGGTLTIPFKNDSTLSIAHRPRPDGGWVTTFDDTTERRNAQKRIEFLALHDELTGLPNRAHFHDAMKAVLTQATDQGHKVAAVGIDLDRFKEVNDAHGHAMGDAVLQELVGRLSRLLRDEEFVGRLGGDEFAAFKVYHDRSALDDFIARLNEKLSASVDLDNLSVSLGASIGVAIYPDDGSNLEQILNNADLAMYRAKDAVGQPVCFYEPSMDEAVRARRVIASDLREAIDRAELSLAYQVQKSVRSGEVRGYEALLRWKHPRDGWVSPEEFIPIAEECGEIVRIGEWVLRTACKAAVSWSKPWRVAVNLSPVQLMHVDLIETVTGALVESGLPASRLELEITETAFISDKTRALHILRQIKALGVSIAIDDFGTGYSSLDTLNSFPFDKIKIDKSFLLDAETSHQARSIIRAVLALGRSLKVPVLAEGLENDAQLRLLKDECCDEAQGYLWGRPISNPEQTDRSPQLIIGKLAG